MSISSFVSCGLNDASRHAKFFYFKFAKTNSKKFFEGTVRNQMTSQYDLNEKYGSFTKFPKTRECAKEPFFKRRPSDDEVYDSYKHD